MILIASVILSYASAIQLLIILLFKKFLKKLTSLRTMILEVLGFSGKYRTKFRYLSGNFGIRNWGVTDTAGYYVAALPYCKQSR